MGRGGRLRKERKNDKYLRGDRETHAFATYPKHSSLT